MIAILGGTGLLGKELQKLDPSSVCTGREIDITNFKEVFYYLNKVNPDTVVNAAAITNSIEVSENPIPAIDVNIIGAANIAKYCQQYGKRLVYISTDYVYPGTGNHVEDDALYPNNEYAWTKLGGECSSRLVKDHCIIRTSFGSRKFPYPAAYTNLFTSKEYVGVLAPQILKIIQSKLNGIVNVGGYRKSSYIYASQYSKVDKIQLEHSKDFSLNTAKYNENFPE